MTQSVPGTGLSYGWTTDFSEVRDHNGNKLPRVFAMPRQRVNLVLQRDALRAYLDRLAKI